jgi:transposase
MGLWHRVNLGLISQKSKLANAIRYALSRWEGLSASSMASNDQIR